MAAAIVLHSWPSDYRRVGPIRVVALAVHLRSVIANAVKQSPLCGGWRLLICTPFGPRAPVKRGEDSLTGKMLREGETASGAPLRFASGTWQMHVSLRWQ